MNKDPKIYFAIDNCFASKRWTEPEQWAQVIADLGVHYVEASADTECDPLYMGLDYAQTWIEKTKRACAAQGVRVANFYSGHGTYSTLGLSHWDANVRARFRDQWIKKQLDAAAALEAGMGFFAHAFDQSILQDSALHEAKLQELYLNLADIAAYAKKMGVTYVGVEQMYSPHQVPWTVEGAVQMLRRIYALGGAPFYLTLDVGHMSGQRSHLKPSAQTLGAALERAKTAPGAQRPWLGTQHANQCFDRGAEGSLQSEAAIAEILSDCELAPHLFASHEDGSPYYWLEELGCYAPIIHLQQTDGKSSPHWAFDAAHNRKGIIDAELVIKSLAKAYAARKKQDMPPRCESICLTLEPFIGTAANPYTALADIASSVQYWRQVLPRDGMRLSEIMELLEAKEHRR